MENRAVVAGRLLSVMGGHSSIGMPLVQALDLLQGDVAGREDLLANIQDVNVELARSGITVTFDAAYDRLMLSRKATAAAASLGKLRKDAVAYPTNVPVRPAAPVHESTASAPTRAAADTNQPPQLGRTAPATSTARQASDERDEHEVRRDCARQWETDRAIRAEFGSLERFTAYSVAKAKGRTQIYTPPPGSVRNAKRDESAKV